MAKQVLLLQLVVVWTQFSLQVGDECGFANIYITNDDGSEQVFTVKHMASQAGLQSSCPNSGSSAPTAGNPGSASTGPTESYASTAFNLRPVTTLGGLLADINRPIGPPHSLHPAPIIGLVVWNAFFFCGECSSWLVTLLLYHILWVQLDDWTCWEIQQCHKWKSTFSVYLTHLLCQEVFACTVFPKSTFWFSNWNLLVVVQSSGLEFSMVWIESWACFCSFHSETWNWVERVSNKLAVDALYHWSPHMLTW